MSSMARWKGARESTAWGTMGGNSTAWSRLLPALGFSDRKAFWYREVVSLTRADGARTARRAAYPDWHRMAPTASSTRQARPADTAGLEVALVERALSDGGLMF